MDAIDSYTSELINSIYNLNKTVINDVINTLNQCRQSNATVYVMGNGGSATTASHIAGDLFKTVGLNSQALTDSNYLVTAYGNDNGYQNIFLKQLVSRVKKGDVLIAISGSGQSQNITDAVEEVRGMGVTVIGLTGFDGGRLKDICDICLIVPNNCMEQIEDIHLMIGHMVVSILKDK